jgi:hypothetical protein
MCPIGESRHLGDFSNKIFHLQREGVTYVSRKARAILGDTSAKLTSLKERRSIQTFFWHLSNRNPNITLQTILIPLRIIDHLATNRRLRTQTHISRILTRIRPRAVPIARRQGSWFLPTIRTYRRKCIWDASEVMAEGLGSGREVCEARDETTRLEVEWVRLAFHLEIRFIRKVGGSGCGDVAGWSSRGNERQDVIGWSPRIFSQSV